MRRRKKEKRKWRCCLNRAGDYGPLRTVLSIVREMAKLLECADAAVAAVAGEGGRHDSGAIAAD